MNMFSVQSSEDKITNNIDNIITDYSFIKLNQGFKYVTKINKHELLNENRDI